MVAYFPSKYPRRFSAAFSAALLVFCLVGTHWLGFAHSISHAGLSAQSISQCSATDSGTGITHGSDACHLYDALTLAGFVSVGVSDAVHLHTSFSTLISSVDLLLLESATASYQSRAPPAFIL
ncbi:hypothetical protein [Polynucleobacter campilacus]|uniref:Uncharacterized protein n=1 Tax=Polynucleobacter campilacus TaxID=1743163 RepID=A0A254PSZ5_9BURK|nr:hypothetical protein [Polynucleobacter campilacus]OWS69434.1 hypothetical protein CBI31_03475 [Polynucleobacter campilacus]